MQELYTRLATEDNANFLISPYSSGLTDAAAVIAEQYGKIMITTGAASDSTYQKGYTLVYQAYTPASHYLTGAVDLLKPPTPASRRSPSCTKTISSPPTSPLPCNDYAKAQGLRHRAV